MKPKKTAPSAPSEPAAARPPSTPGWAPVLIRRHWDELLHAAGEPAKMPLVAAPAGRGGAPSSTECDRSGCTMATGTPGLAFRLTDDADEGGFAIASLHELRPPPGVARVRFVARLPTRREGRRVFVIWRDAALEPTAPPAWARDEAFLSYLQHFVKASEAFEREARAAASPGAFAAEAWARARREHNRLSLADIEAPRAWSENLRIRRGESKAGFALSAARLFARALEHTPSGSLVGRGLGGWMDLGLLLAGVGPSHLGLVERGPRAQPVVIRPGRPLLLDPRYVDMDVPPLAEAVPLELPGRRANPGDPEGAFRALFDAERARFARACPRVARARLRLVDTHCPSGGACAERDVAYASMAARGERSHALEVVFVRRALALPHANQVALVRHELGHLADPRFAEPGPGAEARADRIAREVGGQPIRYDERDLQTVGPGRARRPAHLHQ